jgi:hypothetical protein
MKTNLDRYRVDLDRLIQLGELIAGDLSLRPIEKELSRRKALRAEDGVPGGSAKRKGKTKGASPLGAQEKKVLDAIRGALEREYQGWYTEALAVVQQLMPDRLSEFKRLYERDPKRKIFDAETYSIQDWLTGLRSAVRAFDEIGVVTYRFNTQLAILKGAQRRFESSLFDIRRMVQADFLDSELSAARELSSHGFLRAAGAVAGVVIEKHLRQVAFNHKLSLTKKKPTIGDFNEILKREGILDVPEWRKIQRLADIRNICAHDDSREPSKDEVEELVTGTDKLVKTLF